jgi:hypothetical protein
MPNPTVNAVLQNGTDCDSTGGAGGTNDGIMFLSAEVMYCSVSNRVGEVATFFFLENSRKNQMKGAKIILKGQVRIFHSALKKRDSLPDLTTGLSVSGSVMGFVLAVGGSFCGDFFCGV